MPSGPWKRIAMDLMGPFPTGENILVLTDYYSKFVEVEIMRKISTEKIIPVLKRIFALHGLPETVVTDNGPQFVSGQMETFFKENGIDHHRVTPYWPQANGQVERQNQTILKAIRIAHSEGENWREAIYTHLLAYRSTTHPVTGKTPAELLFGRKICGKIPEITEVVLDPQVMARAEKEKEKMRLYTDKKRKARECPVAEGDRVIVRRPPRDKLSTPFGKELMTVDSRKGNQVVLRTEEGVISRKNVTEVKRFVGEKRMKRQSSRTRKTTKNKDFLYGRV